MTTLIDAQAYPAAELARLYARRWRIELWFRDLKTSMGMERLSCHRPKMVHKELEMFLIAYNLIRALVVQAGAIHDVPVDRISFKGTVDASRQYSIAIALGKADQRLTLHDPQGLLKGRLDHELVQRGTLKPRGLLQSFPQFRRHASRDAGLVLNCRWHSVVWPGAILSPVHHPVGDLATRR